MRHPEDPAFSSAGREPALSERKGIWRGTLANHEACSRTAAPCKIEPMSTRTFTLEESRMLLPVLESLLRTAIEGKKFIEEVDAELEALAHRIFLNGGTFVNIPQLARRKAEREKTLQRVKDAVAEIHATGVQVKDLDIGLLDFPAKWKAKLFCCAGNSERKRLRTGTAPKKASPDASPSTSASNEPEEATKTSSQLLEFSVLGSQFSVKDPQVHAAVLIDAISPFRILPSSAAAFKRS